VELAGIEIARLALLELAELLTFGGPDTAAVLLIADAKGNERVSVSDREAILNVGSGPPRHITADLGCGSPRTQEVNGLSIP
jgi:hypothetical protein